jgi:hypothetical protein
VREQYQPNRRRRDLQVAVEGRFTRWNLQKMRFATFPGRVTRCVVILFACYHNLGLAHAVTPLPYTLFRPELVDPDMT